MKPPETCSYWMTDTFQCGRSPVQADYVSIDPIHGERLIASLCGLHDRSNARRYAMVKSFERRVRPGLLSIEEIA